MQAAQCQQNAEQGKPDLKIFNYHSGYSCTEDKEWDAAKPN